MDPEAKLAKVARTQHSVFTRAQAIDAGFAPSAIDRAVRKGRWQRLAVGVYVIAATEVEWRQRLFAALLACGDAIASHRSALTVWGLAPDLFVPELTAPAGSRRRQPGVIVHRSDLIESCRHDGFVVSRPMRTLLDAATCAAEDRLDRIVDDACRRGLVHIDRLREYVSRPEHRSRPGSRALRELLNWRESGRALGSDLETMFFRALREAGLPPPQPQFAVDTRNGRRFVDFAYPDHRLAIEIDGYTEHGTRTAFEADRARQNDIELLGFRFLRFTWRQITRDPIDVVITVGRALNLRPTRWRAS